MLAFEKTLQFIISQDLQKILLPVKIAFIVFSLILLIAIIYFLTHTKYLYYKYFEEVEELSNWRARHKKSKKRKLKLKPMKINLSIFKRRKRAEDKEWERIYNKLKSQKEIDHKLALVDADKLLNKKLEKLGVEGRNLSEKLEKMPQNLVANHDELKEARKLVNQILLDEDKEVDKTEAEEAIKVYKKAFDSLKK
jgi:hypothetical protein